MRLRPFFLLMAAVPFSSALAAPAPQTKAKPKTAAPAKKAAPKKLTKAQIVDNLWEQSDVKFHAGDYPGAVAIHRKIVALEPTDTESYSVAAWLLWSMGKREDGVAFIQQGLKANPKSAEMWDVAGQHYSIQKRGQMAETAFATAINLSGKKADKMLRRRYAHDARVAGHLGRSAQIWRALVTDFPTDAVNKSNLAKVEKMLAESQKGKTQQVMRGFGSLV